VSILGIHPRRRRFLQALGLAAVGAVPLIKLGKVIARERRKKKPEDLSPIPWIGHC
jgi:hypothetical protein